MASRRGDGLLGMGSAGERIVLVGVCAAGKTTLTERLLALGYKAKGCAQEHSYVPDMWQRLSRPDLLIYLDVSYEGHKRRRQSLLTRAHLAEERRRLAHARAHCDIYLDTTNMTKEQVLERALEALCALGLEPGGGRPS